MAMASSDSPSGGDGDRDVFGSLPNTRPQRRSARRDRAGAKAKAAAARPGEGRSPRPPSRSRRKARRHAGRREGEATHDRAAPSPPPAARADRCRPPAPEIPPAGYATPRADDDGVPHGAQLVTTAVQAAGELAQIGLAAGGRALKSALGRLPRP